MQNVQQHKVVFVLIDGLSEIVAHNMLGYMEGMAEQGVALRTTVRSVLPSLSRPCYASMLTGQEPARHGITTNDQTHRIETTSVFDILSKSERTSAVAGYHWMSELFSRGSFDYIRDREQDHNSQGITHGRFYFEDGYPDTHVFVDAERLRQAHDPDLLVIHPMGCDDAGHRFGSASKEYAISAGRMDFLLAKFVPIWWTKGYHIIVTADHGMNEHGLHGGTEASVRTTPLYVLSSRIITTSEGAEELKQTQLASLICQLLDLAPADTMTPLNSHWQGLIKS